jgi:protoporphyrinogen oxidase
MTNTTECVGSKTAIIIGAGPAGLTAAYELCKAGLRPIVLEQDALVGGLAKTINHKGFRFDIGGHRFYTKVKAADDLWREVLPAGDFLRRQRLSRIYYNKNFFHYPLRASSLLFKIGLRDGLLILPSYCRARLFPTKDEQTFEQWVTNRFGKRLYQIFFKSYTEKVWGMPCSEITAEWAAQRIKGLSLSVVLKDILFKQRDGNNKDAVVKTLINEFDYPRHGPGMMWERMSKLLQARGGTLHTNARIEKIHWRGDNEGDHDNCHRAATTKTATVEAVEMVRDGKRETLRAAHFISSMPIRELVRKLSPAPPAKILEAAENLRYRDFLSVVLIFKRAELFPDNWIYIHDPEVKVGRVQNFKNWSSEMVPDQSKTCLGLEYFCFEDDNLWSMSDAALIELGKSEIEKIGLARACDVEEGIVLRVPKAYPVYDSTSKQSLAILRRFFDVFSNFQLIGRNGMHKYNNQDHSMLTAMLAAENILGANHDLWAVNTEPEYQEEAREASGTNHERTLANLNATQPLVPERIKAHPAHTSIVEYET